MKTQMIKYTLLLGSILLWTAGSARQLESKETLNKELSFESSSKENVLYIANINGYVHVTGYNGDKVLVQARKTIQAKTADRLQEGKALSLGTLDRYDTLIVYINGYCDGFFNKPAERRHRGRRGRVWQYGWDDCDIKYDFRFDFDIKVPYNSNLYISTINEGDVSIAGIKGNLSANNINGGIELTDVQGTISAYTINGDIRQEYKGAPKNESKYYTLNGDIQAYYDSGVSADMTFKSFNGDLYSNISELRQLPSALHMKKKEGIKGVAYQIDDKKVIRVRQGGAKIQFETFNGDVYVKEI